MELVGWLTYIFLMAAARTSILLLYRRIFTLMNGWFRLAWWTSMSIVLAYSAVQLAICLSLCAPHSIDTLWHDPSKCRGTAGDIKSKKPIILAFLNAAVDLGILLLPIRMVWNLQMAKKRKILVSGLFGLGLL